MRRLHSLEVRDLLLAHIVASYPCVITFALTSLLGGTWEGPNSKFLIGAIVLAPFTWYFVIFGLVYSIGYRDPVTLVCIPAYLIAYGGWIMFRLRGQNAIGTCSVCGYDLRETPKRCPECGTPRGANSTQPRVHFDGGIAGYIEAAELIDGESSYPFMPLPNPSHQKLAEALQSRVIADAWVGNANFQIPMLVLRMNSRTIVLKQQSMNTA